MMGDTNTNKSKTPPGPTWKEKWKYLKILRNDPLEFMTKLNYRFGDISYVSFLKENIYIINRPDWVRYVLQENNQNYTKSIFYKELKHVIGNGLLTNEGENWRKQRRLAQPTFKKNNIANFSKIVSVETDSMLNAWKDMHTPFDLSKEMMKLTFLIIGKALFTSDLQVFSEKVGSSLSTALVEITDRIQSFSPLPLSISTPGNQRLKKAINSLNNVVYHLINERAKSNQSYDDFLDMLMNSKYENTEDKMSHKQLRDEITTFLLYSERYNYVILKN